MPKQIFLATDNQAKIERFAKLLKLVDPEIAIRAPRDFSLDRIFIEENGRTLAENAQLKARAYLGLVPLPILANDTGFFVEGEGLVEAPKRVALQGQDEKELTKEQIAQLTLEFWKGVARRNGGSVNAAWIEAFILLEPDGTVRESSSRREVILTDKEFGPAHVQMPVRALYISQATGRPAVFHSEEEERLEMQPIIDALSKLMKG